MVPRRTTLSARPQRALKTKSPSGATTWNHANALTRVFPPEIMSQVFIAVRDLNLVPGKAYTPYYLAPLVLGHVCSIWRAIALSTPHLWTYFTFILKPGTSIKAEFSMLKCYLQAAKGAPFSLNIGFFLENPGRKTITFKDYCRSKLAEGGHTITHLELWGVESESWVHDFVGLQQISSLVVAFKERDLNSRDLHLDQFHNLRKLKIVGVRMLTITLSPTHITHLIFEKMTVVFGLSVLTRCPNLTSFEFTKPLLWHRGNTAVSRPTGPICLQYLSHLSWTYMPSIYYSEVFPYLQLPALLSLVWRGYYQPKPACDQREDRALQSLIQCLPTTLLSVEIINGGKWSPSLLSSLFTQIPSIKTLRLSKSRHVLISDILSLLLSPLHSDDSREVLLPSLEELIVLDPRRISNDGPEWREDKMILGVLHLFRAQKPGTERTFTVHFARSSGYWTCGMHDAYCLLRQQGYPFRVWTDAGMTRTVEDAKEGRAKGGAVDGKRPAWR